MGILLLSILSLSLFTQRETATQIPGSAAQGEPRYKLELEPELSQVNVGDRFEVELWVEDATPGLNMNKLECFLEVTPGHVTIPDVMYSAPGDFIPYAFLVILDATHSAESTSARYRVTSLDPLMGSTSENGLVVVLAFDAISEGTAQLLLSSITAYDSSGASLSSPTQAMAEMEIGPELTGLPFDEGYNSSGEGGHRQVACRQLIPVRFEIDEWHSSDAAQAMP